MVKKIRRHFDMIHERDRQTDRRTPHDGYSRAYAWHRAAKIGIVDSAAAFWYSGFNYNICVNINTASCSTWRQTTAVVNRARPSSRRWCGHSTVAKRVRHSEAVVNNRRPLCWRRRSRTGGGQAFICSARFLLSYWYSCHRQTICKCLL